MQSNRHAAFLNSALEVSPSPADLSRMLLDYYLRQDRGEQELFVMQLVTHVAATEAVRRIAAKG